MFPSSAIIFHHLPWSKSNSWDQAKFHKQPILMWKTWIGSDLSSDPIPSPWRSLECPVLTERRLGPMMVWPPITVSPIYSKRSWVERLAKGVKQPIDTGKPSAAAYVMNMSVQGKSRNDRSMGIATHQLRSMAPFLPSLTAPEMLQDPQHLHSGYYACMHIYIYMYIYIYYTYIILYYIILYYFILYYIILYYIKLY